MLVVAAIKSWWFAEPEPANPTPPPAQTAPEPARKPEPPVDLTWDGETMKRVD
jgi:hypothetical protein